MNAGQFVGREQIVGIVDVEQRIELQELTRRVVGVRLHVWWQESMALSIVPISASCLFAIE